MSADEFHKHKPKDIKPQGAGSTLDADKVDGLHASELGSGHARLHAIDSDLDHSGTLKDAQIAGTPASGSNTPNTSLWGETGVAVMVIKQNPATGKPEWGYINSYDIKNPAQITGFTVTPSGSYPEGTSAVAMVGGAGGGNTDVTPVFAISYQGTPTAATIDILSETGTPLAEKSGADYPATVSTPFTSLTGPAIYRKTSAVATTITFRVTATVDGQTKTKDVVLYFYNERMYGVSDVVIDTQGEIDTFRASATKALSNSKAFSVTLNPSNQYLYFVFRATLGTPSFTINGFPADDDMENLGPVSWLNPRGFTENYSVWKSKYLLTGSYVCVVT